MSDIVYFKKKKNMSRPFTKDLRNTYPQGEEEVNVLYAFLKSRGWKLPDGSDQLYMEQEETDSAQEAEEKKQLNIARWYDALEMMDYVEDRTEEAQTGGENE